MKIATFNANSIRSRLDQILSWLSENLPDVLCIQETKVQDADFPIEAFSGNGYEVLFRGQKKYNGVAILSRHPMEEPQCDLPGDLRKEARFLKVRIQNIILVNTYIPQGQSTDSEKFQYKLDYFNLLFGYFSSRFRPEDLVVWVGDFNAALEPIDVYDPDALWGHVCYCEEVQKALRKIMKWGFTDVFRKHHSEGGNYTFWDYRVPNGLIRNLGWRLDYIMATLPAAKTCTRCWIDRQIRSLPGSSDHTYLTAEFAFEKESRSRR